MAPPISSQTAARVLHRLKSVADRRRAVGMQYLVVRDGEIWLEHCGGYADTAPADPVTPRTTFNAYSITKTFTAAAVVAMAEEALLDLDTPIGIAAGVEGLEAYGSVRETLLHRAGFPNPNPLRWIHRDDEHESFDEAAFVRTKIAALRGTHPGRARNRYSNIGYLLLGLVIERLRQVSFTQAIQAHLFEPLHLCPDERLSFAIGPRELHAHGHIRRHDPLDLMLGLLIDRSGFAENAADGWVRLRLLHVNGSAYGGLMANARGLARFGRSIVEKSGELAPTMGNQNLDIVPGPGPTRSLGWFNGSVGGHRFLAHAGGGLGYYGEFRLYPKLQAVSCLLTNGSGLKDARCLDDIDAAWLAAE